MTTETLIVEQGFTTLDLLLFRRFRREIPGLVEKTLNQNQGIAGAGAFLPVGTEVIVEIPAPSSRPAPRRSIRLFD